MNLAFFKIIFLNASSIGQGTGWGEYEFYVFLGTVWIVSSVMQTFFMPNAQEFSELIRTGNLDFALLKPIDTQFLISFPKFNWPSITNSLAGIALVIFGTITLCRAESNPLQVHWWTVPLYIFFLLCGIAITYSILMVLASLSVWFGRNQNFQLVYFYMTQLYRYPMEIFQRDVWGIGLWSVFTFLIPVLVVTNIPARILARPLRPSWERWEIALILFAVVATISAFAMSRWIFTRSLRSYKSASS